MVLRSSGALRRAASPVSLGCGEEGGEEGENAAVRVWRIVAVAEAVRATRSERCWAVSRIVVRDSEGGEGEREGWWSVEDQWRWESMVGVWRIMWEGRLAWGLGKRYRSDRKVI